MPRPRASLIWLAALTCMTAALLVSLGVWQLQRRAWKEGLISDIATRANAAPQPLPPVADWPMLRSEDYEYRRVTVTGTFEHGMEALVFRPSGGSAGKEPGYHVLTPLRLTSGGYVIVNRGFVSLDRKEQSSRLSGLITGEIDVTGLMRAPEARNFFTPPDNPAAGQYFTRDPGTIAKHLGLAPAAPFSIDAEETKVPGGWPKDGATVRNLPNNHFSHALTWFGLAATVIGVFAVFVWQRR